MMSKFVLQGQNCLFNCSTWRTIYFYLSREREPSLSCQMVLLRQICCKKDIQPTKYISYWSNRSNITLGTKKISKIHSLRHDWHSLRPLAVLLGCWLSGLTNIQSCQLLHLSYVLFQLVKAFVFAAQRNKGENKGLKKVEATAEKYL